MHFALLNRYITKCQRPPEQISFLNHPANRHDSDEISPLPHRKDQQPKETKDKRRIIILNPEYYFYSFLYF